MTFLVRIISLASIAALLQGCGTTTIMGNVAMSTVGQGGRLARYDDLDAAAARARAAAQRSPVAERSVALDELEADELLPFEHGVLVGQLRLRGTWGVPEFAALSAFSDGGERLWDFERSGSPATVRYQVLPLGDEVQIFRQDAEVLRFTLLDARSGELRRQQQWASRGGYCSTPTEVFTVEDDRVTATTLDDGATLWSRRLSFEPRVLSCNDDSLTLYGAGFAELDMASGAAQADFAVAAPLEYAQRLGGRVFGLHDVERDPSTIVPFDYERDACAWDADSGERLWCSPAGFRPIYGGNLYAAESRVFLTGTHDNNREWLWVRRPEDGALLADYPLPGAPVSNAVRRRDHLYVLLQDTFWFTLIRLPLTGGHPETVYEFFHEVPRNPVQLASLGEDLLIYGAHRVVRVGFDGTVRWSHKRADSPLDRKALIAELRSRSKKANMPMEARFAPGGREEGASFGMRLAQSRYDWTMRDRRYTSSIEREAVISGLSNATRMEAAFGRASAAADLGNAAAQLGTALGEQYYRNADKGRALRTLAVLNGYDRQFARYADPISPMLPVGQFYFREPGYEPGVLVIDPETGAGWRVVTDVLAKRDHTYPTVLAARRGSRLYAIGPGLVPERWDEVSRFEYRYAPPALLIYDLDSAARLTAPELAQNCPLPKHREALAAFEKGQRLRLTGKLYAKIPRGVSPEGIPEDDTVTLPAGTEVRFVRGSCTVLTTSVLVEGPKRARGVVPVNMVTAL